MGHVVITVLGMVAQMERRFLTERQRDGIEAAKHACVYKGGVRRATELKSFAKLKPESVCFRYRQKIVLLENACLPCDD